MTYILVDTNPKNFYPLTYTRPVSGLRVGIYTLHEKWEKLLGKPVYQRTEPVLQELFEIKTDSENVFINSKYLPTAELVSQIEGLKNNQKLIDGSEWVACRIAQEVLEINSSMTAFPAMINNQIDHWSDAIDLNSEEIKADLRHFHPVGSDGLSASNIVIGKRSELFIHPSAVIEGAILNTTKGSIYVGERTVIQEGACIRGPFAALEGSVIKMGAKIYEGTTVGPSCMVGGEVKNVIFQHSSNKAHDGYVGNSFLGEGVNIGAGTSCSNLKNTGTKVSVWDYLAKEYKDTGRTKLGCVVGDHSKIAINSTINTGATIGVSSNVFGEGLLPKWIPNFSWGKDDQIKFDTEKAIQSYQNWCKLQGKLPQIKLEETLRYLAKKRE